MKTLTVERKRYSAYNIETILRDEQGRVKAIFPSMLRQPKKGTRQITINCNKYLLDWDKVK